MAQDFGFQSDGVAERFAEHLASAPEWMPKLINHMLSGMGPRLVDNMRAQVLEHRYTGELDQSITDVYNESAQELVIGPTAKRGGQFDAGLLLQMGVPHPIPNLPYAPIAAWAEFRGIPAVPVWLSIRAKGVKPHPFVDETLERSQPDINQVADDIVDTAARYIVGMSGGQALP